MDSSKKTPRAAKRGKPRGQAMVEYTIVTHFLLIGGTAALLPVIVRLFEGISLFYDGVYTVIETGAL